MFELTDRSSLTVVSRHSQARHPSPPNTRGTGSADQILALQLLAIIVVKCTVSIQMSKYQKGDHLKIEVTERANPAESEWLWLFVDHWRRRAGACRRRIGSEPVAVGDMKRGQQLAVSYKQIPTTADFPNP